MLEPAVLTAKDAIRRHMRWRMTLQFAIATREALSPEHLEQIRHFRLCAIGRWLDSPATFSIRNSREYADLVRRHVRFHEEMEVIAELLESGRFEDAGEAMRLSRAFDLASEALAAAIMACDRVLPIAAPLHSGSLVALVP